MEVKKDWGTVWTELPFRYATMHFPTRKRDKVDVHATHHMIVGGDFKRLFVVKREAITNSPIVEKWVRNRSLLENFYEVNVDHPHAAFYFKKNGRWVLHTKQDEIDAILN